MHMLVRGDVAHQHRFVISALIMMEPPVRSTLRQFRKRGNYAATGSGPGVENGGVRFD